MHLPINYIPDFLSKADADIAFKVLQGIEWVRRDTTPRMEYFTSTVGKPYTYGKGDFARTYEPNADVPYIGMLNAMMKDYADRSFELCFLNRYLDQSQHLGWHSDDSPEIAADRPIAIISLGVEREIWFRPKTELLICSPELELEPRITRLRLAHGSLCLMHAGMQQTHQHRIPKAGFQCGERISLTYRGAASA